MASGEFAEPIYGLLEELGDTEEARELVFSNLIKFLPGHMINDFVESFRGNYDLDDPTEDYEPNSYVMCLDCQDTYHEDEAHQCKDTEYTNVDPAFFSSLIPEC